jgi:hypothetical protein
MEEKGNWGIVGFFTDLLFWQAFANQNHEKTGTGQLKPRFEPGTSQTQVNQCTSELTYSVREAHALFNFHFHLK